MIDASRLIELLACPRCDRTPLAVTDSGHRCPGCGTEFPSVGGIPWLFADPESSLGEWRNRLHHDLTRLAHEAGLLREEVAGAALRPLTRRRLELHIAAIDAHRRSLRELLAPLGVQSQQASYESHLALRTRLPVDQGLNTYYANVHRDWCWGVAENEASLEQIRSVTDGGGGLGDMLILGAGACRLAFDLHTALGARR
ncbi:MAG TPA: hypothetical protein VE175_14215, partial [Woeseiaceae bacterium]|nr:hypothetical protein [Woeseiaceae bacterium]